MRILIIRHGEPDYEHDALTAKGEIEAKLLSERLQKEKIDYIYTSPLGRARLTAKPTLEKLGKEEVVLDWLREFIYPVTDDEGNACHNAWDQLPRLWTVHDENFTLDGWKNTALSLSGDIGAHYDNVVENLDALISKHGYVRRGMVYEVQRANTDTIALFCHFGLESVLLSRLLNLPIFALWHGTVALTSSVTVIATEEREKGIASFRMSLFGDCSHLSTNGEELSFSARFCEIYDDMSQRH